MTVVAEADARLRDGDLLGARSLLVEAVRAAPADQQVRMFLFQILCILGDWEKARSHLRALSSVSPEAQMLAVTYNAAIEAETVRARVFAGEEPPVVLTAGSPWAADLATALGAFAKGESERGIEKRDAAFEAAPDTPGEFNGDTFPWIADGDARFGPTLEAVINGRWGLVPFDALERIESEGPVDLRDLVWLPVQIAFKAGQSVAALLPTRYPGSERAAHAALRLARRTDWSEAPWGPEGLGQHEWSLGEANDVGLLSLRSLVFS